jgi:hypothetical protein
LEFFFFWIFFFVASFSQFRTCIPFNLGPQRALTALQRALFDISYLT